MMNPRPDVKCLRQFALTTGAFFAAAFGLLFPYVFEYSFPVWPWVVAAVLTVTALTAPVCLGPLFQIWTRTILTVGRFNSRIVMGIIFYGIVTPLGLFLRLIGKNPIDQKIDASLESYRLPSSPVSKDDFNHPF